MADQCNANSGKLKLFQVAVLFHPTEDEAKAGKVTEVLVQPGNGQPDGEGKWFPALDDDQAFALALDCVPKEYKTPDKFRRVEVAVRPF